MIFFCYAEVITEANYGPFGVDDHLDSMFRCQFNSAHGNSKVFFWIIMLKPTK